MPSKTKQPEVINEAVLKEEVKPSETTPEVASYVPKVSSTTKGVFQDLGGGMKIKYN